MSVDAMISSQSLTPMCWHFISHARLHEWFSFGKFRTTDVPALGELWSWAGGGVWRKGVGGVETGTPLGPSPCFSWSSKPFFSYPASPHSVPSSSLFPSSFSEKKEMKV